MSVHFSNLYGIFKNSSYHVSKEKHLPSDSFIFPAYGCELQISDGLVAAAFASLPQPGQSILILHCVLELTDGEIGAVVGMSRSAVQRHRTKTLETMRTRLTGGIAE